MKTVLPIDDVLDELTAAMSAKGMAVLQAPPGAGKTTRVPLALLKAGATDQKIVMLEPRRLAARAAAERLASEYGCAVGDIVGYRMRGESKVSAKTRIEVVTEGILTRQLQHDPELSGIGLIIFDEFHERSLNADLGLALCLEVRAALRDDLQLLVMSATLDAAPVAALMGDAPMITSAGRSFSVEPRWLDRPLPAKQRFDAAMAELIIKAAKETDGNILAFLPGQSEISRTASLLASKIDDQSVLRPLYGAMPFKDQRTALQPEIDGRRKIVLATAIAETSLTIDGITAVVDGGKARRARFDPGSGMTRLVTERVSRAEAVQRAGRAGRLGPGTAYKLWSKGEDGSLPAFAPPEIVSGDLTALTLELAQWGGREEELAFLDPPPAPAMSEARGLLNMLGALDPSGRITSHGKRLAKLPLHPRLAHMLAIVGPEAAPLAALLSERDVLGRSAGVDLAKRIAALVARRLPKPLQSKIDRDARQLAKMAGSTAASKNTLTPPQWAALAYPDRIAKRRKGGEPRYAMTGGKGSILDREDALAGAQHLVVTDTDGNPREARIRQAIEISAREIRDLFEDQMSWKTTCAYSKRERRVIARKQEKLGAILMDDRIWNDAPDEDIALAMLDGVRDLGFYHSAAAERFIARAELVRDGGTSLPDYSPDVLMAEIETWLLPYLTGVRTVDHWKKFNTLDALRARLSWDEQQLLDRSAPAHWTTPLGRNIPIDYDNGQPQITLRLQEMFGQASHPTVGNTPLRITLLSPGQKPVQTTQDLPGFWASSYADVRKDMRGRYPKHPWPENPLEADPTLRVKRKRP